MNTDELRDTIWEDLFRTKMSKSIDEIASRTARDVADVRDAVNHEWFTVAGDRVSIAYAGAAMRANRLNRG